MRYFIFLADEVGGDAGRLKDGGQAAAGMRASADQITIRELFELVVSAHVKHLVPAMRHVESSAQKDGVLFLPVIRGDDQLAADVRRDVAIRCALTQGAEDIFATLLLVFLPVDTAEVVGHRYEDVESRVTGGRA